MAHIDSAHVPELASALDALNATDFGRVSAEVDAEGHAVLEGLLTEGACRHVIALYDAARFRSQVDMSRHGYGKGEYRYFDYPLPPMIAALRSALFPRLVPIANRWSAELNLAVSYPDEHAAYLAECHAAGQVRPTPLVLKYGAGDYNRLHQDLYGDLVFPLQVAILLSEPRSDFDGGEFVMTEQRPRMQSRPLVVPLRRGDAVVFAVRERPVTGARGVHRVHMRHGVSRVRRGQRFTLGIIFHDAA